MHACACGGVCVRVGLASHLQTGNSHIVITTPRSGEDFCLNRNQYLWGWSPMLSTQTKWGRGFHFPRERQYGHLQIGVTSATIVSGSQTPGSVPFTLGHREGILSHPVLESCFFASTSFYYTIPCWSPDKLPVPHLCSFLCLTPLKLVHDCRNTGS